MTKDAVLRKMGRVVSGRLQLPAATRLVRYAAAREYEDGNLAEARRLYEKLSEGAQDTATRLRLGVIAERQERFEAALRTYTEVADHDPACGEAFYRAGCLLKRQDDPEAAFVFFSRALSSGVRDRRYSEHLLACLPACEHPAVAASGGSALRSARARERRRLAAQAPSVSAPHGLERACQVHPGCPGQR